MTASIDRPIIVVGTHRSGTTFLGNLLAEHPDVAYWEEPRHIWTKGNAYKPDDVLTADDATERIKRRIRGTFASFTERHGTSRFAEKTPSNCLRLEFIEAVFPDARYVHIYRDGRAVVNSTMQMVTTRTPDKKWIIKRLAGTPPWEWPSYASRLALTVGSKLRGKGMAFWGPRPPGWREWLDTHEPREAMLARQWVGTIAPVLEFRERVPEDRWVQTPYETLVRDPERVTQQILATCELPTEDRVVRTAAESVDASRVEAWRERMGSDTLERIRPILEPTLQRLGYAW